MNIRKTTLNHLTATLKQLQADRAYIDKMIGGVMGLIQMAEGGAPAKPSGKALLATGYRKGTIRSAIFNTAVGLTGDFTAADLYDKLPPAVRKKTTAKQLCTPLAQMAANGTFMRTGTGRFRNA